jgi:hypothetical protein
MCFRFTSPMQLFSAVMYDPQLSGTYDFSISHRISPYNFLQILE